MRHPFRHETMAELMLMTTQIDQMVRFIKQEAQEKANEIGVSAEEVGLLALLWVLIGRCYVSPLSFIVHAAR
jgi:hypothetical protein